MAEALAQVKLALGADAVILHTRTLDRRRWLKRRPVVEITASRDVRLLSPPSRRLAVQTPDGVRRPIGPAPSAVAPGAAELAALKADLTEVKGALTELVQKTRGAPQADVPEALFQVYLRLVQNQVADTLARDIIRRVRRQLTPGQLTDAALVRDRLLSAIQGLIHTGGPIRLEPGRTRVVALIGPTGVGKTTTIAKLAAEFTLRQHARVALVSIDTYRIGAPEQLRIYADILNVPLRVCLSPEDLRATLNDLAGKHDLILVDTAGRSQHDAMKLHELKRYLAAAQPDETHLVVSTVAHYQNILSVIERFSVFHFDKLILSKLDEAVNFGIVLSVIAKVDKRLSYITTGQDVPDDIEVGQAERLAQLIVKESTTHAGSGGPSASVG
jgi:flagellar biosynthesis protein FlhF